MCNDMKYVKYGNNVRGGRDGLHELSVIVRDSREFSGLSRLWRGHSVHLPDWTRPDNNVSGLDIDWPTDQGAVVNAAKLPLTPQPGSQPSACLSNVIMPDAINEPHSSLSLSRMGRPTIVPLSHSVSLQGPTRTYACSVNPALMHVRNAK